MERFEEEALATATHPPSLWKRYVDDAFVIQEEEHSNEFFQHVNSIEEKIKFTAESTRADGAMPFLDTLVTPRKGWKSGNQGLQKAHSHKSISAVGQPPCHKQQV